MGLGLRFRVKGSAASVFWPFVIYCFRSFLRSLFVPLCVWVGVPSTGTVGMFFVALFDELRGLSLARKSQVGDLL